MARRKKNELEMDATAKPEVSENTVVVEGLKVPFSVWVDKRVKSGKLKAHQIPALKVFFKNQDLKELETAENYNAAFARF